MSEEKINAYTMYATTDYVDEKMANVGSVKDWNVNDENDPAYIKNRSHWTEESVVEILPETAIEIAEGTQLEDILTEMLIEGTEYTVTWNGVEYTCLAKNDGYDYIYIGNQTLSGGEFPEVIESSEPFFIITYAPDNWSAIMANAGSYTVSIKMSYEEVHKLDIKYLHDGYPYMSEGYLCENVTIESEGDGSDVEIDTFGIIDGAKYTIIWDDVKYELIGGFLDTSYNAFYFIGDPLSQETYPFLFMQFNYDNTTFVQAAPGSHTFSIIGEKVIPMDTKYLVNGNIVNGSAEGSVRTIGTNIEIGENAFAEGENTFASGIGSHAEGRNTIASGDYSHAEGYNYEFSDAVKVVSGDDTTYTLSGWSSAITIGRHLYDSSNGIYAKIIDFSRSNLTVTLDKTLGSLRNVWIYIIYGAASGDYSHAEGRGAFASGDYSHAEGRNTIASGDYAHAEGRNTIASGEYQHVQGKYNIEDSSNTYAHIVGNGTSSANSNAHTLDWDGNAWYAGTIKVGGISQDDENAVEVATKNYVDEQLNSVSSSSKLISHVLPIEATEENQTIFPINLETFDAANDTVLVQDGITLLLSNSGFTVENNTIVMTTPWGLGDTGSILILKNTPVLADEVAISGAAIENNSITLDKLSADITTELDEIKKSASDGKALVAGAITDKGIETAADATFETMVNNINNIITLDSVPSLEAAEITPGIEN
jgi:hypothetical protein